MRDAECVVRPFIKTIIMISALGSIGVGLINNAISQANVEDQRRYNERFWHMQNAYNSPSAMADRMRAAGLNPHLMTGAQPAGSINASPPAQTMPIENPLLSLKTIAEIENINASTGRTETEAEKVMKEIGLLDIALERGLIEKDDYDRKVKAYWKAYEDKSEFDLDREKTEAGIENTEKDTALKDSQISLNEALEDLSISQYAYQELKNGRYNEVTDAEIAQTLADAQHKVASALAQKAQAKYTAYLAQGYKEDHAYQKSLWVIEREILKNQKDLGLSEAQSAEVKAYFDQLYKNGPESFGQLGQFLFDGLFGRSPVRVSAR